MPIVARGENPAADLIGLSSMVSVRRPESQLGARVQRGVVPELGALLSPVDLACSPKFDRTAAFAVIFTRNHNAKENRREPDYCNVLWR